MLIQEALKRDGNAVKPRPQYLFRPFIETPLHKTKVVILGREPSATYSVDGLAYSYPGGLHDQVIPQALNNILEELENDVGVRQPSTGSLVPWAQKGVLLLNSTLTVKQGYPFSHAGLGWHHLVNEVLETVYLANPNAVFMAWGDHTEGFVRLLPKDAKVIPGSGPGIVGANKGWWKSKPFSRTNLILGETGQMPIDWSLS